MNMRRDDEDLVVLQVCTDHLAAEVLANFLRAHGVDALVRNIAPLPGLEQGSEVWVSRALLHRARWLNAVPSPTEAELEFLATGHAPESDERSV
ncbi:MAG TPA: hypothetical protein VN660_09150 [Steroidobacteraceae bacterium]|nr:hypothetical protein [Steroidobacteraceae bacterium]